MNYCNCKHYDNNDCPHGYCRGLGYGPGDVLIEREPFLGKKPQVIFIRDIRSNYPLKMLQSGV